jgi:hypothetical protein
MERRPLASTLSANIAKKAGFAVYISVDIKARVRQAQNMPLYQEIDNWKELDIAA